MSGDANLVEDLLAEFLQLRLEGESVDPLTFVDHQLPRLREALLRRCRDVSETQARLARSAARTDPDPGRSS